AFGAASQAGPPGSHGSAEPAEPLGALAAAELAGTGELVRTGRRKGREGTEDLRPMVASASTTDEGRVALRPAPQPTALPPQAPERPGAPSRLRARPSTEPARRGPPERDREARPTGRPDGAGEAAAGAVGAAGALGEARGAALRSPEQPTSPRAMARAHRVR